jgi:NAD(P)H-nitrite reductase large subunit
MGITKGEIIKAAKEHGLKTSAEIGEALEAGTVCGGCIAEIDAILKEVLS